MFELAQKAGEADIEELILIADELRYLEEKLVEIDPKREPLPPFEEDKKQRKVPKRSKGKSKRTVARRAPKRKKELPDEDFEKSLDSFEPEGEWDIKADDVDMNDLLVDSEIEIEDDETAIAEKIVRVIKTPKAAIEDVVDAPPQLKLHISKPISGEEE